MIRLVLAAALIVAPAAPAFAQANVGITHQDAAGAAAGRSPHRAYRQIAAAGTPCRTVAIHVPAGKLPHYGSHMRVDPNCSAAAGLAANDPDRTVARD